MGISVHSMESRGSTVLNFYLCCVDSFVKPGHSHKMVLLVGSCQDPMVIKVSLGTIARSLYKQGPTVTSLDGTELLVAWFEVYNIEILRQFTPCSSEAISVAYRPTQGHGKGLGNNTTSAI